MLIRSLALIDRITDTSIGISMLDTHTRLVKVVCVIDNTVAMATEIKNGMLALIIVAVLF
jgi:hypothetical protein